VNRVCRCPSFLRRGCYVEYRALSSTSNGGTRVGKTPQDKMRQLDRTQSQKQGHSFTKTVKRGDAHRSLSGSLALVLGADRAPQQASSTEQAAHTPGAAAHGSDVRTRAPARRVHATHRGPILSRCLSRTRGAITARTLHASVRGRSGKRSVTPQKTAVGLLLHRSSVQSVSQMPPKAARMTCWT
jgi:hypothetical protein